MSLDAHEKELSSLTGQVHGILNQAKTGLDNLNKGRRHQNNDQDWENNESREARIVLLKVSTEQRILFLHCLTKN